jgi:hypothetical protein
MFWDCFLLLALLLFQKTKKLKMRLMLKMMLMSKLLFVIFDPVKLSFATHLALMVGQSMYCQQHFNCCSNQ